jgi:hypothetical protein
MINLKDKVWLNSLYFPRKNTIGLWREKFLGSKWLQMNETVAFKKLVRCSKTADLRKLNVLLYKFRCKREHHTSQ